MGRTTRVLTDGIYFGEGPRWHKGRLWFSDFFAHAVRSVSPSGDLRTEFEIDDRPSGLGWMPDGSMLVVSMTKRQVLKRSTDGVITVHADLSALAAFHCNDMIVDAQGRAYVGNFGFDLDVEIESRGIPSVIDDHPTARLARVDPDGSVRAVADDLSFPNGPVITPDGKTLILGETLGGRLTAYDIAPDGGLSGRRIWAETWPRVPDGICLDEAGAIWIANPIAPECVRIAKGGAVLEVIDTGMPCYACMLGGEDGRTLFMLIGPTSLAHVAAVEPKGRIIVATVDSPRAGRP